MNDRRRRIGRGLELAAFSAAVFLGTIGLGYVGIVGDQLREARLAEEVRAQCTTDSECAALCPAGEPACDGGPQSAPVERADREPARCGWNCIGRIGDGREHWQWEGER